MSGPGLGAGRVTCAVIIPVGPGHEVYAVDAVASAWAAWHLGRGPFTDLAVVVIDDTRGEMGRSAARNRGMDENPTDWHFFLDADDQMMPGAFGMVDLSSPATFGAVFTDGRTAPENRPCVDRATLLEFGPRGTLSMGCFVRGDLGLRFNADLDVGEDFDFYLRLPGFTKVSGPLVNIGYSKPSAGGPRGYVDVSWMAACDEIIRKHKAAHAPPA